MDTQGESGLVYRALLQTKDGKELVAVKTVKGREAVCYLECCLLMIHTLP